MKRRIALLALVGLAVPFQALAGGSGGASSSPSLEVSVSLDHCGLADTQIVCKIDAGWNSVPGAESYSVTATSSSGSLMDMGQTSGQSSSVWMPYSGPGTYSVQVTAWGTPPGENDNGPPEVIAKSTSVSGGAAVSAASSSSSNEAAATSSSSDSSQGAGSDNSDQESGSEVTPPVEDPPPCEPDPPVDPEPAPPAAPSEAQADDGSADSPQADDSQDDAGTIPVDDPCDG